MTEWRPDKLGKRLPNLQARARLQAAMRQWFAAEGFVEVETPILQAAPGAEVHLAGFVTDWELPDGEERERWLHSSPEFAMKKLLAGGVPRLFQFARVFRNAEGSALHHPEFTMLEWYRAGAGYEAIMEDCAALLALTGVKELRWGEHVCDPRAEPERLTVAQAFRRHAGVDLLATVGSAQQLAQASGVAMHAGDTWDDVFFRIMFDKIEHRLGMGRPTILCEYPISMAALARAKPGDPQGGRTLRALCLRRRARQRLRRAHRSRHPARPPAGRHGREGTALRRALAGRRGFPRRPRPRPAGLRRRGPGLRPSGHAGDGRPAHRGRAVATGALRRSR